jgi:hypothetical protein
MALYEKTNGKFIQVSPEKEQEARSNPDLLIGNDGGYDFVLPEDQAEELKVAWMKPAPEPIAPLTLIQKIAKELNISEVQLRGTLTK